MWPLYLWGTWLLTRYLKRVYCSLCPSSQPAGKSLTGLVLKILFLYTVSLWKKTTLKEKMNFAFRLRICWAWGISSLSAGGKFHSSGPALHTRSICPPPPSTTFSHFSSCFAEWTVDRWVGLELFPLLGTQAYWWSWGAATPWAVAFVIINSSTHPPRCFHNACHNLLGTKHWWAVSLPQTETFQGKTCGFIESNTKLVSRNIMEMMCKMECCCLNAGAQTMATPTWGKIRPSKACRQNTLSLNILS